MKKSETVSTIVATIPFWLSLFAPERLLEAAVPLPRLLLEPDLEEELLDVELPLFVLEPAELFAEEPDLALPVDLAEPFEEVEPDFDDPLRAVLFDPADLDPEEVDFDRAEPDAVDFFVFVELLDDPLDRVALAEVLDLDEAPDLELPPVDLDDFVPEPLDEERADFEDPLVDLDPPEERLDPAEPLEEDLVDFDELFEDELLEPDDLLDDPDFEPADFFVDELAFEPVDFFEEEEVDFEPEDFFVAAILLFSRINDNSRSLNCSNRFQFTDATLSSLYLSILQLP